MSYIDQERRTQQNEGNRMSRPEGRQVEVTHKPRGKFSSSPSRPKDSAPKGHDATLKAWQADGTTLTVELMAGADKDGNILSATGVLVDCDRYTITLRRADSNSLIYKHAIMAIHPEPTVQ